MNEIIFTFFYHLAHQSSFLDGLIVFIAVWYGYGIFFLLFLYLLGHTDKRRGVRDLVVVITSAVVAWLVAVFLKDFFHTLRPFAELPWVQALVTETDYAFPSGHAMFFSALASSLWFYHKRLAIFFALSAVIIGIARITAGIHWPIDIFGGLILGCFVGVGVYSVLSRLATWKPDVQVTTSK